jgi:hypothetical protein
VSGNVFIDPLDLTAFGNPPSGDSPGFTQLVQDVLGTGASTLDGFDAALADASALVDALDAATGEQDAALDALLVTLDTSKPDALDTSMAGYAGTAAKGAQIVADGNALAPPPLLELPISAGAGGLASGPPALKTIDLGTLHLGGAATGYDLGSGVSTVGGQRLGVTNVQLVNSDQPEWSIVIEEHDTNNGDQHFDYSLTVQPLVLGKSTAQVNVFFYLPPIFTIYTFTVNVVP